MIGVVFRIALSGFLVLPIFAADDSNPAVPLTVPAGTPLRLYLTHKISKTAGSGRGQGVEPVVRTRLPVS